MPEDGACRPADDTTAVTATGRRAVLFEADLTKLGGGCIVAAWAAQALLAMGYRLTIVTWASPGLAALDAECGTALANDARLTVREAPTWMRRCLARPALRLALLRRMLLERWARAVVAADAPDLVVSTSNETDLGRPLVQYVHYPWGHWPRPDAERRWFHVVPAVRLYRAFAHASGGFSTGRMAANTTLANSEWTAALFHRVYGLPAAILHPPVPVPGGGLPWQARENVVLCIARMSPEKRLVEALEMVRRLRARGHDLRLVICGNHAEPTYEQVVARAVAEAGPWAELHLELPREALVAQMAQARYGLHAMVDEHFGIAVAEMARMGCLVFTHASGGAEAIVAEPRLSFADDDEAVARMAACLEDATLREMLLAHLARRAALYGTEAFIAGLSAHCERLRRAATAP